MTYFYVYFEVLHQQKLASNLLDNYMERVFSQLSELATQHCNCGPAEGATDLICVIQTVQLDVRSTIRCGPIQ